MRKTIIKDIILSVIVLGCISLIAGAILGLVNHFTIITEAEKLDRVTSKIANTGVYSGEEKLEIIKMEGFVQDYQNGGVLTVFKGGSSYVIHCYGDGGYSDNFEILVNITDNKIQKIASYSSGETPGVGTRVFNQSILSQFYQKDLSVVKKLVGNKSSVSGGNPESVEIKTVTGASRSSTALLNAVNVAIEWYLANGETDK